MSLSVTRSVARTSCKEKALGSSVNYLPISGLVGKVVCNMVDLIDILDFLVFIDYLETIVTLLTQALAWHECSHNW